MNIEELLDYGAELEPRTVKLAGVEVPVVVSLPEDVEGDDSLLPVLSPDMARQPMLLAAAVKLTPTQKKQARRLIRRYCERTVAARAVWGYAQWRPIPEMNANPEEEQVGDCSGHCIKAFRWSDRWSKFLVEDPGGLHYSGYGNTGTILTTNASHTVPPGRTYFVGDAALYGPSWRTKHVVTCMKGGTAATALWASHGNSAGPYPVRLHYRGDLLCVVRPRSLR